jgi:ABC-2 type transport system permease protein
MLRETLNEIVKIKSQKKNYVVLFGHLLFLLLCYLGFKTSKMAFVGRGIEHRAGLKLTDFRVYLDGLFFARIALVPTFVVLMPIFICTLAGDMIAGEIQEGSLKLYAARPRSRTTILMSKILAVYVVNLIYCAYFAIIGVIIGMVLFGKSDTQLIYLSGIGLGNDLVLMPFGEALIKYATTTIYFSFSMMALGSIALFFSTVFDRMTGATVASITIYFVCYIVEKLPFAEQIRPWLLSKVMNGAIIFWLPELPWGRFVSNISALALYICGFCFLAIFNFNLKDIK